MPDLTDDPRLQRFRRGSAWVLANPRAGRGRATAVTSSITRALLANGWSTTLCTDHPAERIPPDGPPAACVVIGGDGTLRAAVARLLQEFGDRVPPVLPVPMGTANLMGQYLGTPRPLTQIAAEGVWQTVSSFHSRPERLVGRSLGPRAYRRARRLVGTLAPQSTSSTRRTAAEVAALLNGGVARRIDVGEVNGAPFLLMAGVGFDAQVVHALDQRRARTPGPVGLLSYALPAISAIAGHGFPPLMVRADGKRLWGPARGLVMVANVPQYGTGFPIVPAARGDDGRLDVLCLPCRDRPELAKLFALAATGGHTNLAGSASATAIDIEITSTEGKTVPVQIDGDPGGHLPITLRIRPAAVPFVARMT